MKKEKPAEILVVDDDANLLELLVDTLTTIGYTATGVNGGLEALEVLQKRDFDLMITDIKMPELDGIALLKKVRRMYPKMPVLFITGVATNEVIGRATADGFLAKPFRISHIEQLIEDTLGNKQEESERPIRRVLIVEDDDLYRDMLTEALGSNDFTPFAVAGAESAMRQLEEGSIDAVVTDIKMPGTDGITLLHRIKEQYPDMPVVLITAFLSEREQSVKDALKRADGFMSRPFEIDQIVDLLRQLSPSPADNPGNN